MTPSILDILDQLNPDPKDEWKDENEGWKLKIDNLARDLEGLEIGN